MEVRRARGVATFVTYPLKDGNGNLVTGVNTLRPQYATFTDANPISTITNIGGFCQELGALGIYYSSLSAAEMANDYVYFIASPSSGTTKRLDILINCTKIASVQAVSDVVTATVSSGTGTGQLSLTNGRVGINWTDIENATLTQGFTLTTLGTVSAVAFVASVSTAVLSNVGTVTGVTNSVSANVGTISGVTNSVSVTTITGVSNSVGIRSGTGANVLNIANGRVGINWTDIANATSSQAFSLTTFATVDGVTSSVSPDWARVNNPTTTVNLTATTIASVNNVATTNFVASQSAAMFGTISGVTNRVDATLTQGVQSQIADRLLFRNLAAGSDGGRTVQDAFRLLRNRRALTFGVMETATLTAYLEDDTATAWTAIVGTASAVGLTDVNAS